MDLAQQIESALALNYPDSNALALYLRRSVMLIQRAT